MVDVGRSITPSAIRSASRPLRGEVSAWRRVDWILLAVAFALAMIGSLLVWSATKQRQLDLGADPEAYFKKHLLNMVIGLVLGTAIAVVDYRKLRTYAPAIYLASCLGLIAVLGIGSTINGAHSWIVLPAGFQIQPSEFAKFGLVVSMAMLLAERRDREHRRVGLDVPLVLLLAAIPMGLIMLQPDVGTVMVFVFTILIVLSVAGVSWKWIVTLIMLGVIVAYAAVALHVLKNYQLDRFKAFTNPTGNSSAAYNVQQARIAIATGGITGQGLFHGKQTQGRFVPEQQTDFVFSVAGEELGLLGAGGIVVLFAIMLWRALRIAGRSPDTFGKLAASGVVAWFVFQTFVNIGMTLGIMPVTGLPLPFVSYGGSSMFADCMAIGLLQNIHMRSKIAPRA
ncbi:MAG TPA: rod shape-determining protein RodA [Mycobacteriales bacterium]|jgi:rod shape determining protein RodA|nr:rod shape-determining protein RodA [Mycobacteriales bacterium]